MSISRIKKETVTIDLESPPSSYTRLGVEAKRWLQTNPKITRTAESQLKSINAPVLRKIIALEKAKTPQKKILLLENLQTQLMLHQKFRNFL